MIRSHKTGVTVSGNVIETSVDLMYIIQAFRETWTDVYEEETVDRLITEIGKAAYSEPEDLKPIKESLMQLEVKEEV